MKNAWKLLSATALLLAIVQSLPSAADTADTLKIKTFPDVGKSVVVTQTKKRTGTWKTIDDDGKLVKEQKSGDSDEETFTCTVLDKGSPKPKKFKLVYDKAVYKSGDEPTPKRHEGAKIIFERKDGKYEASVEGDLDLPKEYLAALAQRVNVPQAEELFLPGKAVKVGDSWTIDLKEVARTFADGSTLNEAKSKADGKLLKVYMKDGKKFGVIDLKFYLALTSFGKEKVDPPLIADFHGTLDAVIDGSSTAGKVSLSGTIKGKVKMREAKTTLEIDTTVSSEEERSAEK